eukprot:scaffold33759_cov76-Amphora_coffeaeformis.AAC.1
MYRARRARRARCARRARRARQARQARYPPHSVNSSTGYEIGIRNVCSRRTIAAVAFYETMMITERGKKGLGKHFS